MLDEVDDALLLALPGLTQIEIVSHDATRVVADAARWDVVRRSGLLDPDLLRDRPVEERDRPWWSLTWARPVAGQQVPPTVHAPTPTDEPLDLPALLIASFPLDPGRRHVAPGPLTDFLVARAAEAYGELAAQTDDPLGLVPGPVAAGALDGALRAAALGALAALPLLRTASGERVHPRDAVVVLGGDDGVRAVLADVLPGLVADHPALGRLGVRSLSMAEVVDQLAALDREPRWWHRLYAALADRGASGQLESLGALPVPLADGRTTRGPRGLLLPGDGGLPEGLEPLGLRVVHAAAAHPLLLRLGAVEATSALVLEQPEVRAAVENAWDHESPASLAEAVLALVQRAGTPPGALPWLGELLLPDDDGELATARELVLPGSLLDRVADPEAVGHPDPELLERWGSDVLSSVGVLADLSVLRDEDVLLDPGVDSGAHDLDDESGWLQALRDLLPPNSSPWSRRNCTRCATSILCATTPGTSSLPQWQTTGSCGGRSSSRPSWCSATDGGWPRRRTPPGGCGGTRAWTARPRRRTPRRARVTCTGSTTRCRRHWRRSGSTTLCSRRSACGPPSRRCWPRPEAPTSCCG